MLAANDIRGGVGGVVLLVFSVLGSDRETKTQGRRLSSRRV
jgi:hypothetical protein